LYAQLAKRIELEVRNTAKSQPHCRVAVTRMSPQKSQIPEDSAAAPFDKSFLWLGISKKLHNFRVTG